MCFRRCPVVEERRIATDHTAIKEAYQAHVELEGQVHGGGMRGVSPLYTLRRGRRSVVCARRKKGRGAARVGLGDKRMENSTIQKHS